MKKISYALLLIPAMLVLALPGKASASSVNYNNVISDAVFDNSGSMTASQIDSFLNKFPSSCLSKNNGYSFADPTGYSSKSSFTYGSNVSAGTVIYHAARAYDINPQVIISTIQKEESLVTGGSSICSANWRYASSLGYGCPDGGKTYSYTGVQLYVKNGKAVSSIDSTCVNNKNYVGFSRQVINASWKLSFSRHRAEGDNNWYINKSNWDNSDDLSFCYRGYMENTDGKKVYQCPDQTSHPSDPYVAWSGKYNICDTDDSCEVVTIANGATAALYTYTPHLHGQALFFDNFTNWFGPTQYVIQGKIGDRYRAIGGLNSRLGGPLTNEIALSSGGKYQRFQNGRIYWKSDTGAWDVAGGIGSTYVKLGGDASPLGYPTSSEINLPSGAKYQRFEGGRIYWKKGHGAHEVTNDIDSRYKVIGMDSSRLGLPVSGKVEQSTGVRYQQFEHGRIYWSKQAGAWDIGGSIEKRYLQTGADQGALSYPTSGEKKLAGGVRYQQFEGGRIYWSKQAGAHSVYGDIAKRYEAIGAQDSRLGYPIRNEYGASGGRYQNFQHGRIYWSKATGAWDLGGSIGDRYYNQLDAETSPLGYPTSGEKTISSHIKYQSYQGGQIYWVHGAGTFSVYGSIGERYIEMGAYKSRLGYPKSNEHSLSTGGVYQQFQKGRIYWSHDTGAWDIGGSIGDRWYQTDADKGPLHYPISGEKKLASGIKYQRYSGGIIYWQRDVGTYSVYGAIGKRYLKIGAQKSRLGYPLSNELDGSSDGRYEKFVHGQIYWTANTGAWDVAGSIGTLYRKLGAETSRLGYPTGAEKTNTDGSITQQYQHGSITYKNDRTTYKIT